jgi:hypothetical protein
MHSMAFVSHLNNTLLNVKDLAFFCPKCMDDNFDFYNAQTHVMPWRLLTLENVNIVSFMFWMGIF